MGEAMIMLTWISGTLSGALWMASLERGEHKVAPLYARFMAYCYCLCLFVIIFSR
jgi:hypothetical protein